MDLGTGKLRSEPELTRAPQAGFSTNYYFMCIPILWYYYYC